MKNWKEGWIFWEGFLFGAITGVTAGLLFFWKY